MNYEMNKFTVLTESNDIDNALASLTEGRGYLPHAGETLRSNGQIVARKYAEDKNPAIYFRADVVLPSGTVIKDQHINFSTLMKRMPKEKDKFLNEHPEMRMFCADGRTVWEAIKGKNLVVKATDKDWAFRAWDRQGNELPDVMRPALIFTVQ